MKYTLSEAALTARRKNLPHGSGPESPRWKGGYTDKNGYRYIQVAPYRRRAEHRVVMETVLGRALLTGENVHHINGIRDDNRPENLELWTKPQPRGVRAHCEGCNCAGYR